MPPRRSARLAARRRSAAPAKPAGGKTAQGARARANAALASNRSVKSKLKTILKVGSGLGAGAVAAYGAYLVANPRFRALTKAAAAATNNKMKVGRSTHRVAPHAADSVKSLLGKLAALMGRAGLTAKGPAIVRTRVPKSRMRRLANGIGTVRNIVKSGVVGAGRLATGTVAAAFGVMGRAAGAIGHGAKHTLSRGRNIVRGVFGGSRRTRATRK